MKYRSLFVSVLVLAALLGTFHGALAVSTDPDTPEVLGPDRSASGTIAGNNAGSFAYYRLAYPGGSNVATIRVTFVPGDPATESGVGFNVYGPNGSVLAQGVEQQAPGIFEAEYSSEKAASWLVQIYNYIPGRTVSFDVAVEGLPTTPTPTPTFVIPATPLPPVIPGATPTPIPADVTPSDPNNPQVLTDEAVYLGLLPAGSGGHFGFYRINYEGGGDTVTIRVEFLPGDPATLSGVGINLYGEGGRLLAQGQRVGPPGVMEVVYAADDPADWLVQVYNYLPDRAIAYQVEAFGLADD